MKLCISFLAIALALPLSGCSKKESDAAPMAAASTPVSAAAALPDVGKVESVATQAEGMGSSAGDAVAEAMRVAILQVNGAVLDTSSIRVKFGVDLSSSKGSAWLRGEAFAAGVRERSGGVIQSMKVVELLEPEKPGQAFKARIEAQIAKFKAPADLGKIKVVVAQPKFHVASLAMGDRQVSADEVGALIQQRLADALNATGRFVVLDRSVNADLDAELMQIASGDAPDAERAKLGQAVSADVVWLISVSAMDYKRFARQLRTSDRELVSYSGGWAASHRLVNVATRQVMLSEGLAGGKAPSVEATTLGTGVDSQKVLGGMTDALIQQAVASLIKRTFPVTIVAREGDGVVLSQGGSALRVGTRYAVVAMGAELKDPQTGQSLGRTENACCEVLVERVTPSLSYGKLIGVKASLDQLPPGALQLRQELGGVQPAANVATAEPSGAAPAGKPTGKAATARPEKSEAPTGTPKSDEKW